MCEILLRGAEGPWLDCISLQLYDAKRARAYRARLKSADGAMRVRSVTSFYRSSALRSFTSAFFHAALKSASVFLASDFLPSALRHSHKPNSERPLRGWRTRSSRNAASASAYRLAVM